MMRDIFYDTEFLDTKDNTELISMAAEDLDGNRYYAIVRDEELLLRAWNHKSGGEYWLRDNVLCHLPGTVHEDTWIWDEKHPDFFHVKSREQIAADMYTFIWGDGTRKPILWAYFSAHDHVLLMRLWGTLLDAPLGIPHRTNCLAQYWDMVGRPTRPPQPANAHDPRADVLWNILMFRICGHAFTKLLGWALS